MYQWKKTSEKPHNQTCSNGTPGKIEFKLPIENGDLSEQRHGAKYTEAEVQQLLMGMILSDGSGTTRNPGFRFWKCHDGGMHF